MNREHFRGITGVVSALGRYFRRTSIAAGVLASLLGAAQLHAAPQYDGSSNLLPNDPTWRWGYEALDSVFPYIDAKATAVAGGGVTTLDTSTQITDRAGFATHIPSPFTYTDPDVVPLDVNAGFELDFTVRLLNENHNSADRAGFSVIALSNDASPVGIELGFWTNEVWAQNVGFTHGESSAAFDTTAGLIDYRLAIQGGSYALFANNSPLLTGSLRNYSASGFPYSQPDFTFFGDDTGEANAKVQIASFNVVAVPEPASFALAFEGIVISLAIFGLLLRGRNSSPRQRQLAPVVIQQQ